MIFQLLLLGKLEITVFLKKNIYKKNNIQKEWMLLTAKYTKILMRVSEVSDSIFVEIYWSHFNLISPNFMKDFASKIATLADRS